MGFGESFKGIRRGDMVVFWARKGGYNDPLVECRKRVNPLLIFADSVVCGNTGMGQVVNERNYIRHYSPKA